MSDDLSTLITKVQNTLGDASATYFTSEICTAGIREALSEFNLAAPRAMKTTVAVVADQKEYSVTALDAGALAVSDVLEQDASGEDDEPLEHDAYVEAGVLTFRLRTALKSGTLVVRYTKPHTIDGLDSESTSTLAAVWDQAIVMGGAYHALLVRAAARVEANNFDRSASDNYREVAAPFREAFEAFLAKAASENPPVSERPARAWNDEWHNFGR